ncbi:60S ribosomal protein L37 [Armadillidium vulgare]|nr:60S ribosomal protein L37 [Armadillidium vulgare]
MKNLNPLQQRIKEKLEEKCKIEKKEDKNNEVAKTIKKRYPDSAGFWFMLAMARVYLASVQTDDVLEIDGVKPWEYSSASPIRSVVFSGFVSLPYLLLRYVSPIIKYIYGIDIMTPKVLIIAPRLFMTLLSFICDFCVFKIASLSYVRPWQCVEVFAGSYIMLVYSTRTFSNSIELVLYSLLLWRVCLSMVDSCKIIRRENVLQDLYETAETMKEKVKIARYKSKLPPYNYVDSFFISVIITFGFFVRPTFTIYSFIPLSYWLQRGVITRELDFSYFNWRCISLVPGILVTFVVCMLTDSFYYNTLTLKELLLGNVTVASFTITPLNFLLYNAKADNLAEHGYHPYFLHIAVNIPLLHGVLGLIGLWSVSKYFSHFIFRRMTAKPKIYSMATMLLASFIVPVFALSFIPHQEPRFLLPTLLPLVLLHSDKISIYALPKFRFTKHFIFLLWQSWNIVCVVFFGFLHQGGVTKTMEYVHDYVAAQPPSHKFEVFFSHMYTPPTFLLMRKIPVIGTTEEGRKFKVERNVIVHDLGSSFEVDELFDKLVEQRLKNNHNATDVILCITASLSEDLKTNLPHNVTLTLLKKLPGHFSMERLPDFDIKETDITESCNKACIITKRVKEFSVDIFLVNFKANNTNIIKSKEKTVVHGTTHTEL